MTKGYPDRSTGWLVLLMALGAYSGAGWALGPLGQPITASKVITSGVFFLVGILLSIYARSLMLGRGVSRKFWGWFGLVLAAIGVLGAAGGVPLLLVSSTSQRSAGILALVAGVLLAAAGMAAWLLARHQRTGQRS